MQIEFDDEKRDMTLQERGLDFARAAEIFAGMHLTLPDDRRNHKEQHFFTVGRLDARIVIVVWTPRGKARRIISMRKANEREVKNYTQRLA